MKSPKHSTPNPIPSHINTIITPETLLPGTIVTYIDPSTSAFHTGTVMNIIHHRDKTKSISVQLKITFGNTIKVTMSAIKYTYIPKGDLI